MDGSPSTSKRVQRPVAIYMYHWLVEDRPYMIALLFFNGGFHDPSLLNIA
jgi:hypothetical protein